MPDTDNANGTKTDWDTTELDLVSSMAIARKFDAIKRRAVKVNTQHREHQEEYQHDLRATLVLVERLLEYWDTDTRSGSDG